MEAKKIAVLCGGASSEREVSLRSGKKVHEAIASLGLKSFIIDTADRSFIKELAEKDIDLACIALHGRGGEDGTIQGLLEIMGIPYTGSGVLASAQAMNKISAKKIWEASRVPTPKYRRIDPDLEIKPQCERLLKYFPLPLVIKPVSEGSSFGVSIIKSADAVLDAVDRTVKKYREVFVEEFIKGKEVTVGILGSGPQAKALPVLELRPKGEFYDYESKYTPGGTDFIIPARLPRAVYAKVQKTALKAYNSLGCRGFARLDIMVDRDGTPYVIDANTIPGMTDLSDLPAQAKAEGISYEDLVLNILSSALK